MARALLWDFFGPRAEPTARHHAEHVRGFLRTSGIEMLACDVLVSEGHSSVRCVVAESAEEGVARALRPRRFEAVDALEGDPSVSES